MSDKHYVGQYITSFADNGTYKPISRVTLQIDSDNYVTAGDDTGTELIATCYHATQEIVDALLEQFAGYEYVAYEATAANLDPSAELGDGITVDGRYSVISRLSDDGCGYPSPSAPGEAEGEDEYPSAGPMTQELNRQLASARSSITKTAKEIELKVEEEIQKTNEGVTETLKNYSTITQTASAIESAIREELYTATTNEDGSTHYSLKYSTITQTAADIESAIREELYVEGTTEDGVTCYTQKYSTVTQTADSIASAITTSKEYTNTQLSELETAVDEDLSSLKSDIDEDLSDLEEAFGKDLSDFAGAVNAKFEKYSTIEQTDEKISTAVHSALYVEDTDENGNTLYVEKYSTTEQTDQKISSSVSESKGYSDGQLSAALENYSTTEQTAESISTSIHSALYVGTETDVLPLTVYEFTAGGSQVSEISFVLEEGVHYYVDWGDTEYDCGVPTIATSSTFATLALKTDAFSIIYMYNNSTMEAITSRITPYADASSVRIFTRSTTVESEKYSTVSQTASGIAVAVSGLVDEEQCQSMIDVSLGKIELVVTNSTDGTSCSIVMKTPNSSEDGIASASIALTGFVTFSGLSDGTTEIDGGCIKTGTISANRIDASNLEVEAANVTGTLDAASLSLSGLMEVERNNAVYGYLGASSASSEMGTGVAVTDSTKMNGLVAMDTGVKIQVGSTSNQIYVVDGSVGVVADGTYYYFRPGYVFTPEDSDLGTSSAPWGGLYASSCSCCTSDREKKNSIEYNIDERYDTLWDLLKPCTGKFNNGTSDRTHMFLISQDVEDAITESGLTSKDFAAFIKSPKLDDDGNVVEGYDYALRYEEFVPLCIRQIQKLQARVQALEG